MKHGFNGACCRNYLLLKSTGILTSAVCEGFYVLTIFWVLTLLEVCLLTLAALPTCGTSPLCLGTIELDRLLCISESVCRYRRYLCFCLLVCQNFIHSSDQIATNLLFYRFSYRLNSDRSADSYRRFLQACTDHNLNSVLWMNINVTCMECRSFLRDLDWGAHFLGEILQLDHDVCRYFGRSSPTRVHSYFLRLRSQEECDHMWGRFGPNS